MIGKGNVMNITAGVFTVTVMMDLKELTAALMYLNAYLYRVKMEGHAMMVLECIPARASLVTLG